MRRGKWIGEVIRDREEDKSRGRKRKGVRVKGGFREEKETQRTHY